ncbi:MAG: hypothetical protein K6U74_12325, partial [Firmicutes bacterium]|nr:hypothetical protein [Bacillota bacterium]
MRPNQYIFVAFIFLTVVAAGVLRVATEFNHLVHPADPVRVLAFRGVEPGIYQIEFLGEKRRVEIPRDAAT